jgi:hypothetical protein
VPQFAELLRQHRHGSAFNGRAAWRCEAATAALGNPASDSSSFGKDEANTAAAVGSRP